VDAAAPLERTDVGCPSPLLRLQQRQKPGPQPRPPQHLNRPEDVKMEPPALNMLPLPESKPSS